MTIKAILRDGHIEPLEPLPSEWSDGQELLIEPPDSREDEGEMIAWGKNLGAAIDLIPPEEHERFRNALSEIERESKEAVRREWGLP